jgi:capsular exopolysaccharide synthesis family protein
MEIKDLVLLLWRNLRFLILGLLLGAVIGIVAAKIETPAYESTTKVLISRTREQSNADMLPLSDDQLVAINLQLAKAQPVLDEASSQLGSKIDPDNIQVSSIPNSLMVQIKVEDTDPKRAAAIANLLVQILIQQNESLLSGRYAAFEDAINSQIDQVQIEIGGLQTEINQINDASIQDQLKQVNQQIDLLKEQISTLQKDIASFPDIPTPIQRATIAEKQAQLDQLNSLMNIYGQIQTNLTYIGKPGQTGSTRDNPRLTTLQSTLALYQQMHLNLISNRESVDLARMQSMKNVVQIVAALPSKIPTRPIPLLYCLLGGLVGSSLAVTAILMIDHFDDSLRTAGQTENSLGIPLLGSVLDIQHAEGGLAALNEPYSTGAEAFRALGASVELVGAGKSIGTLMVVNAGPKDGKTTIAANLAMVNAQQGKQVILVDGDIRNPHLHRLFGIENRQGLAELIDGRLNIKSVCQEVTDVEGMMLIPGGLAEKDSTEWLDAKKVAQLFLDLKEQSDLVILDSPPPEIADAQVFASQVDAVLLAIDSGHTCTHSALDTLHKFQLIGANVLGTVLNRKVEARIDIKNILTLAKFTLHRKGKDIYEENSEADKAPVTLS